VGAALAAIQPSAVQADGWWQRARVFGNGYRQVFKALEPEKRLNGAFLIAAKAAPTIFPVPNRG
jgi:hypothetical protein